MDQKKQRYQLTFNQWLLTEDGSRLQVIVSNVVLIFVFLFFVGGICWYSYSVYKRTDEIPDLIAINIIFILFIIRFSRQAYKAHKRIED